MLKRIPKDFLQVYAFNISAKVIQFLISVVLIRNMPNAEEYALYTQFYTLATALSGIVGDSLSLAYVRYNTEQYSKNPQNDVDRLFLIIQIINSILIGFSFTHCGINAFVFLLNLLLQITNLILQVFNDVFFLRFNLKLVINKLVIFINNEVVVIWPGSFLSNSW